jgi:predicted transcriptional regulator
MPADRAKRLAVHKRRQQVAELYLRAWTQQRIAEQLGISQTTVCFDLQKIRKHWRESAVRDFDLARAEELQKLEHIEREAYEAWEQSKKPAQSAVVNGEASTAQAKKTIKNRHGDPRMLEILLKCSAERRKMLGLDAPAKIAPVTPDGQQPFRLAVESLSVVQLRALQQLHDRQRILTVSAADTNDDGSTVD